MANYSDYSDEQLASLFSEGNKRAYTEIYERYWYPLWIFAANTMRTDEEARDLVQEVFMTLWEKHENIHIHTSLKAFLYKSTLHLALKQVDKAKHAQAFYNSLKKDLESISASLEAPIESLISEKELLRHFENIIESMPPKMREAFVASRYEQLSYKEIAERMQISPESVKTHIKHALAILRKGLLLVLVYQLQQTTSTGVPLAKTSQSHVNTKSAEFYSLLS